jgi:3-oxoacyl-[acyl-carrier protein] reductase
MELAGQKILVTGGGRGIGNFLANSLAQEAEHVFILDNDETFIASPNENTRITKIFCNITDYELVNSVINTLFAEYGGVDVCINNAGIIHNELLVNFTAKEDKKHRVDTWKKVMDVNLNGTFYVSSVIAEHWLNQRKKGLFINISSIAAQGNVGQSAYSASKAAVEALTKTWSKELGMFKIRTACIAPGFFDTHSTRENVNEHMLDKWKKSVPLNRLGKLEEIHGAVKFIIQNDYFNGKVLALDGGLTI